MNNLIFVLIQKPLDQNKSLEVLGVTNKANNAYVFFRESNSIRDVLPFRLNAEYFGPAEDKDAMDIVKAIKGC